MFRLFFSPDHTPSWEQGNNDAQDAQRNKAAAVCRKGPLRNGVKHHHSSLFGVLITTHGPSGPICGYSFP